MTIQRNQVAAVAKIERMMNKAAKFAKYEDTNRDFMSEPDLIGYSAKGDRIVRRAIAIAERFSL